MSGLTYRPNVKGLKLVGEVQKRMDGLRTTASVTNWYVEEAVIVDPPVKGQLMGRASCFGNARVQM